MSSASDSLAIPAGRPLGLIAIVLIIDIGLAAAGGVLLSRGLASKDAKKLDTKSEPAPAEKKSEAPAPANNVDQVAAVATPASTAPASTASTSASSSQPPVVPATAPPAAKQVAAARADATQQRDKTSAAQTKTSAAQTKSSAAQTKTSAAQTTTSAAQTKTSAAQTKTSDTQTQTSKSADDPIEKYRRPDDEPQDPYPVPTNPVPNTEQEIDKAAAKSKATFDRCASSNAAHGSIKIAFQVRADGRVINAAAVENTTDNTELARCLVGEISTWSVSAHNGATVSLVRPFTYP